MDAALAAKLDDVVAAFDDTLANLADPEVLSDQDRYRDMARRHSELKPITEAYQSYMAADTELTEAREMRQAESSTRRTATSITMAVASTNSPFATKNVLTR